VAIQGENVMSEYPDCYESSNVLCKHSRATITVYLDLDKRLPPDVTVSNPMADPVDATLTVEDVAVVSVDTTVESDSGCSGLTLIANRAIQMTISGGEASDDESIVTVGFDISNGDQDYLDCRILVGGVSA
jgi:hypothetical protein